MAKKQLGLEEIASEVGRLFGTTEQHARKWLDQRNALLEALRTVRDQANKLMTDIGGAEVNREYLPWPFGKGKRGASQAEIRREIRLDTSYRGTPFGTSF